MLKPAPFVDPIPSKIVHGVLEHQEVTAPHARNFWHWLGLGYAAIDIDGSPDAIPLDLNYDDIPKPEKGKYQLITNFGTTEHVANQLNAFKVIHDLTAVNGVMVHNLPAQGMLNHGLVNYNFKFFWMLARSNGYKWLYADLHAWNNRLYSRNRYIQKKRRCLLRQVSSTIVCDWHSDLEINKFYLRLAFNKKLPESLH